MTYLWVEEVEICVALERPRGQPIGRCGDSHPRTCGVLLMAVDLCSAGIGPLSPAFCESCLDETDFAAQHVGGFPAEIRPLRHKVEKSASLDMQHLRIRNCYCGEAVGPSGERGGNPQKRPWRQDSIQLLQVLDRQTNSALQHQINPLVLLICIKYRMSRGIVLDDPSGYQRLLQLTRHS